MLDRHGRTSQQREGVPLWRRSARRRCMATRGSHGARSIAAQTRTRVIPRCARRLRRPRLRSRGTPRGHLRNAPPFPMRMPRAGCAETEEHQRRRGHTTTAAFAPHRRAGRTSHGNRRTVSARRPRHGPRPEGSGVRGAKAGPPHHRDVSRDDPWHAFARAPARWLWSQHVGHGSAGAQAAHRRAGGHNARTPKPHASAPAHAQSKATSVEQAVARRRQAAILPAATAAQRACVGPPQLPSRQGAIKDDKPCTVAWRAPLHEGDRPRTEQPH